MAMEALFIGGGTVIGRGVVCWWSHFCWCRCCLPVEAFFIGGVEALLLVKAMLSVEVLSISGVLAVGGDIVGHGGVVYSWRRCCRWRCC